MANLPISGLTASTSNIAATDLLPVTPFAGIGVAGYPLKYTGQQLAGGLLGSATFNAATVTTSQPVLNLSQTWNDGAVTFTGLLFTATNTASNQFSKLIDLKLGANTIFQVSRFPNMTLASSGTNFFDLSTSGLSLGSTTNIQWGSTTNASGAADLILRRATTATLQLGAADAAAPVAQTLQVQSVVAGTSNTAGTNWTLKGSAGTGTGAGGSIIFQTTPSSASGTALNTYRTALTIAGSGIIYIGNQSVQPSLQSTGNARLDIDAGLDITKPVNLQSTLGFEALGSTYSSDLFLARDAINSKPALGLRNGTTAQLFRVFSTYTDAATNAFGGIGAAVNLDGTAGDANTLYIGSQKTGAPTALTKLAIQVDGTTRVDYNITTAGVLTFNAPIATSSSIRGSNIYNSTGGVFAFGDTRSIIASSADGRITLMDSGQATFDRLMFGGTTSSFPALKRSTTTLQVRLADDTANAALTCGTTTSGGTALNVTGTGDASIMSVTNTTSGSLLSVVNSSSATVLDVNSNGSVICNSAAVATTATDGFLYVPSCAGTPTGVPTTYTGRIAVVADSTNNKLYIYSGGAWVALN